LAEYTEDSILIQLQKPPQNGWLQRLDNDNLENLESEEGMNGEGMNNKYKVN